MAKTRRSAVIERPQADGYRVTAPKFPESSLADDVARLRQVPDRRTAAVQRMTGPRASLH